jgi:hypothetical protein
MENGGVRMTYPCGSILFCWNYYVVCLDQWSDGLNEVKKQSY